METQAVTFALYFGNRGFFPEKLISSARSELTSTLNHLGYQTLLMDESATRYGAVEGAQDGIQYAQFLKDNRGNYDGVILCLPNFGDETGAIAALRDCGVPILIHAYPDELDKMGFSDRRDAFCGKLSVMDVFYQYGLPFTTFQPHTVAPASKTFATHVQQFAAVCRVSNGMRRMTVGAIGARTTAFKTVRYDEVTLQRYGITTESLDLSEVFLRLRDVKTSSEQFVTKADRLKNYTNWTDVPEEKFEMLSKLGVVIDDIIDDYKMDCLALRCWLEMEKELGVSPCVIVSELNDQGVASACEVDVCNAIMMHALLLASQSPATCLDWNNNYGDDPDKCILFHCGPVPQSLMTAKGHVIDHPMFAKALGAGCGWGCNVGRIAPTPITFASSKTTDGQLWCYLGQGEFTRDEIADGFFGCAGVARIENLQDTLEYVGHEGYRHHVSVTTGNVAPAMSEAFTKYLGYELKDL
jgi:L-fucose isomerase-like protein